MDSENDFTQYVEALNALGSVERLQRDALRRAVQAASATESKAMTQMADQQRMYDLARQEADKLEHLIGALRVTVGYTDEVRAAPTAQAGTPPRLAEVRATIQEISQWATATMPVAASLMRTKARLAQAPKPAEVTVASPLMAGTAARKASSLGIAAVIALVIVIVIVIVLLIQR